MTTRTEPGAIIPEGEIFVACGTPVRHQRMAVFALCTAAIWTPAVNRAITWLPTRSAAESKAGRGIETPLLLAEVIRDKPTR